MKTSAITFLLALLFVLGCSPEAPDVQKREISFHVAGMYCAGCVAAITDKMQKLDGAEDVRVTLEDSLVVASFPENKIPSQEELSTLLEELGYTLVPGEESP